MEEETRKSGVPLRTRNLQVHYGDRVMEDGKPLLQVANCKKKDCITLKEVTEDLLGKEVMDMVIIFK